MLESKCDHILSMGDKLFERVVGQDKAISVVTQAIQSSRAGLNDPTKHIALLVFLGPTGQVLFALSFLLISLKNADTNL